MIEETDKSCGRMVRRLECMHADVYNSHCFILLTASGKKKTANTAFVFFQKTKAVVLFACVIFMVFLIVEIGCAPKVNSVKGVFIV